MTQHDKELYLQSRQRPAGLPEGEWRSAEAIILENSGPTPEPGYKTKFPFTFQQINTRKSDHICIPCGINFLTPFSPAPKAEQKSFCYLCGNHRPTAHIRYFNNLTIPDK